ncbi:MAG: GntR family transcriptional regulator [Pseudomonadota bacterium]
MNKKSKEALYDDIKRCVLTMEFEPGQSLDEASLGRSFGLSRTPVRDVLRLLAGEGYLTLKDNRGAFVSPMTLKTLRSFFRTAPPTYAAIAALAVENHTAPQLVALKAAQRDFVRAVRASDAGQMVTANNHFHLVMGEMADNPYLWPSLQRLLIDHARIGQTFYRPRDERMRARMNSASEHHDEFIATIERGDVAAAHALAHAHWELSREDMDLYARPAPLDFDLGRERTG